MMRKGEVLKAITPYLGVILMQFGSAGSALITKAALNHGMSHYTYSVYRNIIAAVIVAPFAFVLERKIRPKMTMSVLYKILLLALVEPVIDQNIFYGGMKYTTATFASAMANMVPAITFALAWPLGLERVNMKKLSSQAKVVGTLVTFGGAMIMTLVKGAALGLPWSSMKSSGSNNKQMAEGGVSVKGALMLIIGCFCWSAFYILQAMTLKSYPAALSLTGLVCMVGAMLGTALTLVVERDNPSVWAIGWDAKLLSYMYSGLVGSGLTYYVAGVIIQGKGPVFVTSFNPLSMIIVAVLSSIIFAEQMTVGKITGAIVIVIGIYLVIWGKAKYEKAADDDDESQKLPELMMKRNEDEEDAKSSTKINGCSDGHDFCKTISAADHNVV